MKVDYWECRLDQSCMYGDKCDCPLLDKKADQKTDQMRQNSPNSDHSANAKALKRLAEREGFEPSKQT